MKMSLEERQWWRVQIEQRVLGVPTTSILYSKLRNMLDDLDEAESIKRSMQTLIIAAREYLHHDGMCDRQNKMSDAYREELKDAIGKAYRFVTGYEWEDGR